METKTITLPQTKSFIIEYILLSTAFLIPFFISGPQLLTGTIVNALLFLFASHIRSKRLLPIIILPSIGALLNGLVFGKFTVFLLYFLPFIWLGNYALVYFFQQIIKRLPYAISVLISSTIKSAILFIAAYLFTSTKIAPSMFLQLMGVFQLYTALLGGGVAYVVGTLISKK